VAALRRGDQIVVPRGDNQVEPGDRVLLITTTEHSRRVGELLGAERS
jgi:Trk K+ transport system NAD-binding subunit